MIETGLENHRNGLEKVLNLVPGKCGNPESRLFTSLRTCYRMAERSRDRSSSNESQPKFPECSHFRRRNDNHRRCQQCRLNVGLPLCTQDSPCLVCQDWLPEAWTAHAKATAQRNRRKAAAAAKAATKETEMMDDSVELHAPRHAFPTKRPKSEESSKTKRSKTVASSSQPKSVAASVSAAERVPGGGSPSRLCPALAESAGQLPGHRHRRGRGGHCIPATTSAHPSKHQYPDQEQPTRPSASRRCLVDEGSHRTCHPTWGPWVSTVGCFWYPRRQEICDLW